MLLQNSGRFLPDYTVSYAKRPWSVTHKSFDLFWCKGGILTLFEIKKKKLDWYC